MDTHMDTYGYKGRLWRPSPTKLDDNNFFHATFGTRNSETEEYFDRYVHIRRKNWKNFLIYSQNETIPDVTEKVVTVEDISILATLENVNVVILSKSEQNPPNIITPNETLLQNYPYGLTKCKGEVILMLEEGFFSRMEEDSCSKSDENNIEDHETEDQKSFSKDDKTNARNETKGYNKGEPAGLKGIQYQIGLLTIFLLNAVLKLEKWKLSTENEDAEKLDDVVIEWPNGAILLQSKFKNDSKITREDLISDNSKKDDFSLPKYFLYYLKAKAKFNVTHIIICTNASAHKDINGVLIPQSICPTSMLHYENGTSQFYKINVNDNILSDLQKKSKSYYDKNCKKKGIQESAITKDNLEAFLKCLQFYCNYPLQNGMEEVIENLLSLNKLKSKISSQEIISKVTDWYLQKNGVYMDYMHAKAKFHEIYRDRYYQTLDQYNGLFQNEKWDDQNPKQLFHIVAEAGYLLHELKIYRDLQDNKKKILYVSPNESIDVQKEIVLAFGQLPYIFLIIILPSTTKELNKELCCQIKNILSERRKYKKIILLAEKDVLSAQKELLDSEDYAAITGYVTFQKLSDEAKDRLLSYKGIIFQGNKVNLNELFLPKNIKDHAECVDLETLQKLVKREEIKVGIPLSDLDERTNKCYIRRVINRKLNDNERVEAFSQDDICDLEEEIILITGSSGMGKTTELTKLATNLKKKQSNLWIIKIDMKDYAGICHTYENKTTNVTQLLSFKEVGILNTRLEETVFSVDKKVILLVDGTDEVSHFTTLLTDFFKQCKTSQNFVKIFATSKPHAAPELERILKTKSFALQPFTLQNQVDFLERYLTDNFTLNRKTYEHYANTLIEMLTQTNNNSGNYFAANPLQAKIAAEQFKEWLALCSDECMNYSNGDAVLDLPEISFITKLFDALIEKKQDDYVNRLDSNRNPKISRALTEQFNKCLTCHEHIALEVILDDSERELFSSYRKCDEDKRTLALEIGLLQKSFDKFHFDCGTFEEYFFAKILLRELKVNQGEEFQKFFLEDILLKPKFKIVRGFFNSLLQSQDSFNLKNCRCLSTNLADHLDKENCRAILQLISSGE